MKLTGTIVLDLRGDEDRPLRYQSFKVVDAPDGCRVVIRVNDGQRVELDSIGLIRPHLDRFAEVDVQADPATIREWHKALRGEHHCQRVV